jgi:hypothetical protein
MISGKMSTDRKHGEELSYEEWEGRSDACPDDEAGSLRMPKTCQPPYDPTSEDLLDEDDFETKFDKLRKRMNRLRGGEESWYTWEKMVEVIHEECGEDIHREIAILAQERSGLFHLMRDVVTDRMTELYRVSKKPKLESKPMNARQ